MEHLPTGEESQFRYFLIFLVMQAFPCYITRLHSGAPQGGSPRPSANGQSHWDPQTMLPGLMELP